ncbi:RNA-directed DNA polymerase, partial [Alkalitalea saponilacus]
MWLLVNSYYAKLVAVFKVITNKGGKTPGVDNVVWNINTDLVPAAKSLHRRGYKPLPLRRIYIRKRNGKKRPLGIPTMKDRAMQALYLLALEPVAESMADPNSYGFRRQRACRDAIQQIFICLAQKGSAQWILEADIKGCFDNISHKWLLENVLIDKQILIKWLKAGYIEKQTKHPTIAGTPQGGIISPTLMNLTMDGLEEILRKKYPKIKGQKVNLIRYADDFIVTAHSKKILEKEITPIIRQFLSERGLSLSDEKTKITHINDGFDFLSQNTRRYPKGKLLIKPSDYSVKEFKYKLRQVVFRNMGAKPHVLINQLNPLLRGWSNYHKHIVSKEIFKEVDYYLWFILG